MQAANARRKGKESEGEWEGVGGSLTCSSLPRKRATAMQMSWNPYTDERSDEFISRQIVGRIHTVGWLSAGPEELHEWWACGGQEGPSFTRTWTESRRVTGWPSRRPKGKSSSSGEIALPKTNIYANATGIKVYQEICWKTCLIYITVSHCWQNKLFLLIRNIRNCQNKKENRLKKEIQVKLLDLKCLKVSLKPVKIYICG